MSCDVKGVVVPLLTPVALFAGGSAGIAASRAEGGTGNVLRPLEKPDTRTQSLIAEAIRAAQLMEATL